MHGAAGITRVLDAGGQAVGHLKPLLDLAQDQEAAVGRQPTAVEAGDEFFASNR